MTSALIPLVGPQALPTLLKAIAVRKSAYPNLIVHSSKRLRQTQGELMDVANPPICQQHLITFCVFPFLINLGERVNETNHSNIGFVGIGSFEFVLGLLSISAL